MNRHRHFLSAPAGFRYYAELLRRFGPVAAIPCLVDGREHFPRCRYNMLMSGTWVTKLHATGLEFCHGLLQLIYPNACWMCGNGIPSMAGSFCSGCRTALTADPHATCARCARTIGPFVSAQDGCTGCRGQKLHFERVLRLGPYEGLLREAILRLKHESGEGLAEAIGALWASHAEARFRELGAAFVVPVPLHWWRRWRRGYNQSEALAYALSSHLKVPCRPDVLRRIRNTPRQVEQTAAMRRENVRSAFIARSRPGLHGETVLLVDDILTTGSTASEAAKALRQAGVARVFAAVLAHSLS